MNSIAYNGLFAHQKKILVMISKPLCNLSCQNLGLLNTHSRKELSINYKQYYYEKDVFKARILITNVHVKGSKYFRRRPIKVNYHEKYADTTLDDYVEEAKAQTAEMSSHEVIQSPMMTQEQETEDFPIEKHTREEMSTDETAQWRKEVEEEEERIEKKVVKNLIFKLYISSSHKVRSLLERVKSSRGRKKDDIFLLEGWRLIADAFSCGLKPKAIFYSQSRIFLNMIPLISKNEKELAYFLNIFPLYKTPYKTMKLWSSLTTPPGIMAVFPLSAAQQMCSTPKEYSFPLTVILDQIRDPSNLGSIVRTLAAVGVYKIIMIKGCCDLWDLKVMRSACGAHFHLYCVTGVTWNTLESQLDLPSSSVFLADACRNTSSTEDDDIERENAESVKHQKRLLGGMSYEELKELGRTHSEHHTIHEMDENGTQMMYNNSFDDHDHLSNFEEAQLPQLFYDRVKFFSELEDGQSAVLILGGETGLSRSAKKFAMEIDAVQVSIPLLNKIESLNSSVVTGILVYEMQKQYMALPKRDEKEVDSSVT